MHKPSTLLYHNHIIHSIDSLDQRKDGYVEHRLQFLKQRCAPIRHKIQAIIADIKFYENMRDTAYEVIQSESQILQLKKQITDYKQTNKYYERKLDEFDESKAKLEVHIANRRKILEHKKQKCKSMYAQNGEHLSTTSSPDNQRRKKSSRVIANRRQDSKNQSMHYQNTEAASSTRNQKLASISGLDQSIISQGNKRSLKYLYMSDQDRQLERHYRNQHRLDKIIRQSQHYRSLQGSIVNGEESDSIQLNQDSIKSMKLAIAQFDHTEALFRECFERKKMLVQKSVTQLQSKLISNKELFLTACQIIGQKQGLMQYDDFCELSSDELITLFISFGWLSKKIYNELAQKRKNILQVLKILKSNDQYN